MNRLVVGGVIVLIIIFISFGIGGILASSVFFALVKFAALVAVVESVPPFRWLAHRLGGLFDVGLFIFSFYMMYASSVTMGISFTIVAFLFTILYRPYVRARKEREIVNDYNKKFKLHK